MIPIKKIEELIDGGDMSSCDSDTDWDLKDCEPHAQYYSLRGEDCPPKISESITEYLDQTERTDGEYAYLFDGKDWIVHKWDNKDEHGFPIFDFVEVEVLKCAIN